MSLNRFTETRSVWKTVCLYRHK